LKANEEVRNFDVMGSVSPSLYFVSHHCFVMTQLGKRSQAWPVSFCCTLQSESACGWRRLPFWHSAMKYASAGKGIWWVMMSG
jgi:hypothetical protein